MAETAALLAHEVLPERSLRQWVLSLPYALRFLLATDPDSLTRVLRTIYRAICGFLIQKADLTRATGHPGAVTLIQHFGSALNLTSTTADLYRRVGFVLPWIGYIAVVNNKGAGGGAFVGPPKDGYVEITYFTLEGEQGRRYAS